MQHIHNARFGVGEGKLNHKLLYSEQFHSDILNLYNLEAIQKSLYLIQSQLNPSPSTSRKLNHLTESYQIARL